MRSVLAFAMALWLLCGVIGAWMQGSGTFELKTIAQGPITLVKAFNKAS